MRCESTARRGWLPAALVAFAAILVGAVPGAYGAPEDPAAAEVPLADQIAEARKAHDDGALRALIQQAIEAHNGTEDAAVRGDLQDVVGKVLKDKKCGDARITAAEVLASLNDKKGAWKQLKGAMPDVKAEAAEPVDAAVLKAVGEVADEAAIPMLLELAQKAKDNGIARDAAAALSGYHGAGKKRIGIFESLIEIGVRTKPSQGGGQGGGGGGGGGRSGGANTQAQERWAEVGKAIVQTLNKITGRTVATFEDWETLYKDNKKQLHKLFEAE